MKIPSLILGLLYVIFAIVHSNYILLGFAILFLFIGIVIAPLVKDKPSQEN